MFIDYVKTHSLFCTKIRHRLPGTFFTAANPIREIGREIKSRRLPLGRILRPSASRSLFTGFCCVEWIKIRKDIEWFWRRANYFTVRCCPAYTASVHLRCGADVPWCIYDVLPREVQVLTCWCTVKKLIMFVPRIYTCKFHQIICVLLIIAVSIVANWNTDRFHAFFDANIWILILSLIFKLNH